MSDRPDWLPEPPEEPSPPRSERLHLAAVSIASLLLAALGLVMLGIPALVLFSPIRNRGPLPLRVIVSNCLIGLFFLGVAYLLRWCLNRLRQRTRD